MAETLVRNALARAGTAASFAGEGLRGGGLSCSALLPPPKTPPTLPLPSAAAAAISAFDFARAAAAADTANERGDCRAPPPLIRVTGCEAPACHCGCCCMCRNSRCC